MMINQYVGLHLPAAISDILHVVCGVSSIILIWAGILHIAIFMMYQEKEGGKMEVELNSTTDR